MFSSYINSLYFLFKVVCSFLSGNYRLDDYIDRCNSNEDRRYFYY